MTSFRIYFFTTSKPNFLSFLQKQNPFQTNYPRAASELNFLRVTIFNDIILRPRNACRKSERRNNKGD